jgi:hypothetical protein
MQRGCHQPQIQIDTARRENRIGLTVVTPK